MVETEKMTDFPASKSDKPIRAERDMTMTTDAMIRVQNEKDRKLGVLTRERDVVVSFSTGNAAFAGQGKELAIVATLRAVANKIEAGEQSGNVRDVNGNRIGSFRAR